MLAGIGTASDWLTGAQDMVLASVIGEHRKWASQLPLFAGVEKFRTLEQLLMHVAADDRLTILYDPFVRASDLQRSLLNCVDMPEIVTACRSQVNPLEPGITQNVARYLQSSTSVSTSASYVPPSKALSKADCLEMLERSNIAFLPDKWFEKNLTQQGYLAMRGMKPKWFHFWADSFSPTDPTKVEVVEGILQDMGNGTFTMYPKCDPGLISFWKAHAHIWNPVSDLKSVSLVVDRAFPYPCTIHDDAIVTNVRLTNVRMLPLNENTGKSSVGVRVSPTFGTGAIFVIPNVDGGLIRGETGDFPRPEASALKQLLGLKAGKASEFWEKAAEKIADLAITHEQRLLEALAPPRIRMWPARKAKLATTVSPNDNHEAVLAEKRKFESVPQAWRLLQTHGLDQEIPQLQAWDPGSKWLGNILCMMTAMRHLRSATLFEAGYTTDLYDPKKLAQALLTAPASDFHAIWLCRILGEQQEVLQDDKQEIQGATLTESADAIFG